VQNVLGDYRLRPDRRAATRPTPRRCSCVKALGRAQAKHRACRRAQHHRQASGLPRGRGARLQTRRRSASGDRRRAGGLSAGERRLRPARLYQVTGAFMGLASRSHPRSPASNSFYARRCRAQGRSRQREGDVARRAGTDVFDALQSTMSALYVNDFNKFGRTYRVQDAGRGAVPRPAEDRRLGLCALEYDARDDSPQGADPTSNVVGPSSSSAFNGFPGGKCWAAASRESLRRSHQGGGGSRRQHAAEGYQIAWTGQAFQEKRTGALRVRLRPGIVMVFLILAALYERGCCRSPWCSRCRSRWRARLASSRCAG